MNEGASKPLAAGVGGSENGEAASELDSGENEKPRVADESPGGGDAGGREKPEDGLVGSEKAESSPNEGVLEGNTKAESSPNDGVLDGGKAGDVEPRDIFPMSEGGALERGFSPEVVLLSRASQASDDDAEDAAGGADSV